MRKSKELIQTEPVAVESEATSISEPALEVKHISEKHSIDIYDYSGVYVRTYSEQKHGDNYIKLAKQFVGAEKNQTRTVLGILTPKYVIK